MCWKRTPGFEWVVSKISADRKNFTIEGELFGRPQTFAPPLDELNPIEELIEVEDLRDSWPDVSHDNADSAPDVDVTPPKPERRDRPSGNPLTAIVDRLVFSPQCLDRYRELYGLRVARSELADHLRRRLLREGKLERRSGRREEYIRIRMPGKLAVIIPESPSQAEDVHVTKLIDERSGGKRGPATGKGRRGRELRSRS